MHIFSAILSGIFIALVIAFALSFGLALFVVLGILAVGMAVLFYIQMWWRRWQIKRNGGTIHTTTIHEEVHMRPGEPPVIDVEYKDITDKKP